MKFFKLPMIWRSGDFRRVWVSNTCLSISQAIATFAASVGMINVLDASPFEAGLIAPLNSIGPLMFGLFAGVAVDRIGRRRTLIGTSWIRAGLYSILVLLFVIGYLSPWQVLLVLGIIGLTETFSRAAQTSIIPNIVGRENVGDAAGSLMASEQVVALVGPAAGGLLVRLIPAPLAFAVSATAQFVSGASLIKVRKDPRPDPNEAWPKVSSAIKEGWAFLVRHKLLLALVLTTSVNNAAAGLYQAAESWFILKDLGIAPELFGIVWSLSAVGGVVGAVVAPGLGRRIGPLRAMFVASLLVPINFAIIPLSVLAPEMALVNIWISFTLFGITLGMLSVNSSSVIAMITPDELMARVSSTRRAITQGMLLLAGVVGATLLATVGALVTLWMAVGVALLQCVFLLRAGVPRRGVPSAEELPEDEPGAGVWCGRK